MNIKLKKISLTNFKGIKNIEIEFKDKTDIMGDNGTGKTTIFDAFCYLLFDKNSKNEKDFGIKEVDKDGKVISMLDHTVEGVLEIDGTELTLKKVYSEKWTKKRGKADQVFEGHTTDYYINDVPVKKKDYEERINGIIPEDKFKLLTNVYYFNKVLDKNERREVLFSLAGDIDTKALDEKYKKDLELDTLTLDEIRAKHKASAKKINDELKDIPIRIDELTSTLHEESPLPLDGLKSLKDKILGDIRQIDEELSSSVKITDEIKEITGEITKLEVEKANILADNENAYREKIRATQEHAKEKERQKEELIKAGDTLKADIALSEENIKVLEEEVAALRDEWVSTDMQEYDGDYVCPTCGQTFPESKIKEIKANFNKEKSNKLSAITKNAENLKIKIESKNEEIKKMVKKLSEAKETLKAIDGLNNSVNLELRLQKEPLPERVTEIEEEIEKLKTDIKKLNQGDNTKLLDKKDKLLCDLEETNQRIMDIENNDKIRERVEKYKKDEKKYAKMYEDIERKLFLIDEYTREYTDIISDRINSMFKYVSFKLFDTQINGGIAETCEATINGVPYSDVNSAGAINAGLEIINAISEKLDIQAPIFIDNAETVNNLIEVKSQLIRLAVTKDKELKVA